MTDERTPDSNGGSAAADPHDAMADGAAGTAPGAVPGPAHESRLLGSWHANAGAWTRVVRAGTIASRRLATDAAVLRALERTGAARALDLGCGEGWLSHALELVGVRAVGVDVSEGLIAAARSGPGTFAVATYDDLRADPRRVAGPFDAVVANFSLLGEDLATPLAVARERLSARGALVIQTLHPLTLAADARGYADGWREETFEGFGAGAAFASSMPWFGRTLESWMAHLADAGFAVVRLEEPRVPSALREPGAAPDDERPEAEAREAPPASLLLTCHPL